MDVKGVTSTTGIVLILAIAITCCHGLSNSMRLFGIGLNKTGTTSLTHALRQLGFEAIHMGGINARLKSFRRGRMAAFEDQKCFLDGDLYLYWRELRSAYPDAKFILTTRDREDWINSRIVHVLHNRLFGQSRWLDVDSRDWIDLWDAHHAAVRSAFPGDSCLLEFDVCGGDGWPKLCKFLDVDQPDCDFPRANSGARKLKAILSHYNGQEHG